MRRLPIAMLLLVVIAGFALAVGEEPAARHEKGMPPEARTTPPAVAPVDSEYPIGPGDVLSISIWKDEALTKDVVVLPDALFLPTSGIGIGYPSPRALAANSDMIQKPVQCSSDCHTQYGPRDSPQVNAGNHQGEIRKPAPQTDSRHGLERF